MVHPIYGSVSANLTVALWSVVGLLLIHFNLLWSCEIQAGFIVPPVIAGLPFIRLQCLIFLYHRHVAQMVRAFVRIVYHVRDAVSKMFKGLARCRRFESYRVDSILAHSSVGSSIRLLSVGSLVQVQLCQFSISKIFPKTKKSFQEGSACLP